MSEQNLNEFDESPTDELPILTEVDVVDLDASVILPPPRESAVGEPDDVPPGPRFPLPSELPDVEPLPDGDDELAFARRQIVLLEATLDDKDAEIASLAERLRATREAVERRDETERRLRIELGEAAAREQQLEARLADAETLAARYAESLAELTSRLRTLEQTLAERDAVFADLEAELIAREARIVERERALEELGMDPAAAIHPSAPARADVGADDAWPADAQLETALAHSREEAAALAEYIDCRRAHWLALEAQLEEHRERVRELEEELETLAERERTATERAETEARRAEELKAQLAELRAQAVPFDAVPRATAPGEGPTTTLRVRRGARRTPLVDSPAPPPPAATLVCLTSDPPAEYRVGSSALLIGRSPHCDIRITTHFVSREHARILRDRQQVLIEDLGSKNGVFVNAVRVERGALRHGDLVTIGETQFRFELEPSAEAVRA